MQTFRWVSGTGIPQAYDLRGCGWQLAPTGGMGEPGVCLADGRGFTTMDWVRFLTVHPPPSRARMLLLGIDGAEDRARLLRLGIGDAVNAEIPLTEIAARAARLDDISRMLPRFRDLGELRLDLLNRDGFAQGRALGLHPREFALIWRLADNPGAAVPKQALLHDVWRLNHVPETNSLAVHVSRLRSKLEGAGLHGLVRTGHAGYFLATDREPGRSAIPLGDTGSALDRHVRLGDHAPVRERASGDPINTGRKP